MTYRIALTALADPTRREIFERLRGGPSTVGALAADLPVSRPAVSQHLKVLREANLVSPRKVGTRHFYTVEVSGLKELREYLDSFWTDVLDAFQLEVDGSDRSDRSGRFDHSDGPEGPPEYD